MLPLQFAYEPENFQAKESNYTHPILGCESLHTVDQLICDKDDTHSA